MAVCRFWVEVGGGAARTLVAAKGEQSDRRAREAVALSRQSLNRIFRAPHNQRSFMNMPALAGLKDTLGTSARHGISDLCSGGQRIAGGAAQEWPALAHRKLILPALSRAERKLATPRNKGYTSLALAPVGQRVSSTSNTLNRAATAVCRC